MCLLKFFWLKTFSYAFYDHFKGKEGEEDTFSKGKRTEIIHEVGIVFSKEFSVKIPEIISHTGWKKEE